MRYPCLDRGYVRHRKPGTYSTTKSFSHTHRYFIGDIWHTITLSEFACYIAILIMWYVYNIVFSQQFKCRFFTSKLTNLVAYYSIRYNSTQNAYVVRIGLHRWKLIGRDWSYNSRPVTNISWLCYSRYTTWS
jgi:hypothetical protein